MSTIKNSTTEIIRRFTGKKILVIGDLILDVYLKGQSTRLSPEAPVPVVDVEERCFLPGGAANTVCNLRKLGATVTFCSVAGFDKNGAEAKDLLLSIGVNPDTVISHKHRKTITKTRIVAGKQVITRFDEGTETSLDEQSAQQLCSFIEAGYQRYDAVILSDYNKGVIGDAVLASIKKMQKKYPRFLVVDSKRLPYFAKIHPSLVKPNYREAIHIAAGSSRPDNRIAQVKNFSKGLREHLNTDILCVTMDTDGSVITEKNGATYRCFAPTVETPHVSGAGDTYLSAFTLAYICGADAARSGEFATAAATVAVRKELTSFCSQQELMNYFTLSGKLITTTKQLEDICKQLHQSGKRIVFTNGCFDILHSGHVSYLDNARKLGDVMIVGVNSDESIRRLKGRRRPINPIKDRLEVLSGLSSVNYVVEFGSIDDDTPSALISIIKPHVFAKGGDYADKELPEAGLIQSLGGELVFIPFVPDHSTTGIINRIFEASPQAV